MLFEDNQNPVYTEQGMRMFTNSSSKNGPMRELGRMMEIETKRND